MAEQQTFFREESAEAFDLQVAVHGQGGIFNPSTVSCQLIGALQLEKHLLYLGNIVNRLTMSYEEKLHRELELWCRLGRRSRPRRTSCSRGLYGALEY